MMKYPRFSTWSLSVLSVLAFAGCGKEVQRTGDAQFPQGQPRPQSRGPVQPGGRVAPIPAPQPRVTAPAPAPAPAPETPAQSLPNSRPNAGANTGANPGANTGANTGANSGARAGQGPGKGKTPQNPGQHQGQQQPGPGAACADPTVAVTSGTGRVSYQTVVNGRAATWQLVDFRAYAVATSGARGSANARRVTSAMGGEALGAVNVWPLCQDLSAMPSGSFQWKMNLPLFLGARDGFISDEVVYSERAVGPQSSMTSERHVEIKEPASCKILTGGGQRGSSCGTWEFYQETTGTVLLMKTVETTDNRGNALMVRVQGRYTAIEGEALLGRRPSAPSAGAFAPQSGSRLRMGKETDFGSVTTRGRASDWDQEDETFETSSRTSSEEAWEDDFESASSADVIYTGQRPCCCQVLSKRDVRRIRRQVRRALRGSSACNTHVIRTCG